MFIVYCVFQKINTGSIYDINLNEMYIFLLLVGYKTEWSFNFFSDLPHITNICIMQEDNLDQERLSGMLKYTNI